MEQQLRRDKREKEIQTHAHLMTLIIYSVFTGLLISVTLLMSWETWTVFIMIMALIGTWGLHIGEIGNAKIRSYIYMICILFETFYYSIHETSFFDMTIVFCIILCVLTILNEMSMIYLGLVTYIITISYHTFVTRTVFHFSDALSYSRLALQITSIATTFVLARYMLLRRREEKAGYEDAIEQLQDMNKQTEDFLANMSHELRTPINAVTGISDVMLQEKLDDHIRNNVLDIQDAGRRLFCQITDILDYSEITSQKLKIIENPYEIASMVNDIVCSIAKNIRKKNLEIIFDIHSQIPSVLYGDQQKIHRIIESLLENAINFTNQGGVFVRMRTREEVYGVNLCVEIEDTGIGMTENQSRQAYDQFYQADSGRSRQVGGMGLGLSIVHGVVKALGGFMNMESESGKGTKVSFCIPQKVQNSRPFVSIENGKEKRLLCYFKKDKYENPRIREFYDEMIVSMRESLKVNLVQVHNQRELENYIEKQNVTHVVIGNMEYDECSSYYDELSREVIVVLIAHPKWEKKVPSQFVIIRKPFSVISIVNALEEKEPEHVHSTIAQGSLQTNCVKALVVDDDSMNLNVASGILMSYGMETDTALGGLEALKKCEKQDYDLIFMDHMMPDLDGIATLKRLRAMPQQYNQQVPVIALTANAMSGAKEMFLGEGFQGFVPKPIQRNMLERVIRHVLPKDKWSIVQEKPSIVELVEQEEREEVEKIEEISSLQRLEQCGIHTSAGIAYCAGSEEFYMEMLGEFYGNAKGKMEDLKESYEKEDWNAYTIAVHTLKGNARTIGADSLSEAAMELQQAGEEKNIAFIYQYHHKMMEQLCHVVENVGEVLALREELGHD